MPLTIIKEHWAAEVKRTKRAGQNIVAQATVGVKWGATGANKALELRLDVLSRWPFVRTSYTHGPLTAPIDEQEKSWLAYLARIECEEAEMKEHWVAPGESHTSQWYR